MLRGKALLALSAVFVFAGCTTSSFQVTNKLNRSATETKIIVVPTDVQLYELDAGGMLEPQAEWTQSASKYLAEAIEEEETARHVQYLSYDEDKAPAGERDELHQLTKLFGTVSQEIVLHQYIGDFKLPTKDQGFDWSLGPSAKALHDATGADYALVTYLRDSYATPGRVAVIAAATIIGAFTGVHVMVPGGTQVGYAALVDLTTGDIVWFNRLARGSGDTRDLDGARGTAKALLDNFPS